MSALSLGMAAKAIFKIARSVDLMLTLFPFEARFYQEHQVPVRFVGHPLADLIPLRYPKSHAIARLGTDHQLRMDSDKPIVALLPGSRSGEIHYLGSVFCRPRGKCINNSLACDFFFPT